MNHVRYFVIDVVMFNSSLKVFSKVFVCFSDLPFLGSWNVEANLTGHCLVLLLPVQWRAPSGSSFVTCHRVFYLAV